VCFLDKQDQYNRKSSDKESKVELENTHKYCEEMFQENNLIKKRYTTLISKTSVRKDTGIYKWIINMLGEKWIAEKHLVLADESDTDNDCKESSDHKYDSEIDQEDITKAIGKKTEMSLFLHTVQRKLLQLPNIKLKFGFLQWKGHSFVTDEEEIIVNKSQKEQ
jgi:hypothetical protein